MQDAAWIVATLVPNLVDEHEEMPRWFTVAEYEQLSSGERAAYDLARDLWTGGGTFPRFLFYVDHERAAVLLSAIHVALSSVWFPQPAHR